MDTMRLLIRTFEAPDYATWFLEEEAMHYENIFVGEYGGGFQDPEEMQAIHTLRIPHSPPTRSVSPLSSSPTRSPSPVSPISPTPLSTPPSSSTPTNFHSNILLHETCTMNPTQLATDVDDADEEIEEPGVSSLPADAQENMELDFLDSSSSSSSDEEHFGDMSLDELLQIERSTDIQEDDDNDDNEDDQISEQSSSQSVAGEPPADLPPPPPPPSPRPAFSTARAFSRKGTRNQQARLSGSPNQSPANTRSLSGETSGSQTPVPNTSTATTQTESEADDPDSFNSSPPNITPTQRLRAEQQAMEEEEMFLAGFKYKEVTVTKGEIALLEISSLSPYRVSVPSGLRCCWLAPSTNDSPSDLDNDTDLDEWDSVDLSDEEVEIGRARKEVLQRF